MGTSGPLEASRTASFREFLPLTLEDTSAGHIPSTTNHLAPAGIANFSKSGCPHGGPVLPLLPSSARPRFPIDQPICSRLYFARMGVGFSSAAAAAPPVPTRSTFTRVLPSFTKPSSCAALRERSISTLEFLRMRSLIFTTTL